ncbi:MAG: hypothetical protein ACXWYD_19050 [Candidatus Binatia bacterium]
MLQRKELIMGSGYTLVDGYALFLWLGVRGRFPMKELSIHTAWRRNA